MRCRVLHSLVAMRMEGWGESCLGPEEHSPHTLLLDLLGNGQERGLGGEEELGLLRKGRSAASSGTTSVTW